MKVRSERPPMHDSMEERLSFRVEFRRIEQGAVWLIVWIVVQSCF